MDLGVQNPELFDSIQGISEAVLTGMAPNTIKAYTRWLQQFQQFCHKIHSDWKEVSFPEVAVFLQSGAKGTSRDHGSSGSFSTELGNANRRHTGPH